ncbi:MAG: YIP1 family protein [Candidatus Methylarchaceae archaeon HK01B]|nr:YIP1 family protein [Candidatus Methylarchaceae archaeon HK01B]
MYYETSRRSSKLTEEVSVKYKDSTGFTGFLDRLGGALLEPRKTFDDILTEKRSILEPLLLILVFFGIQGALVGVFFVRIISSIFTLLSPITGFEQFGTFQAFSFIIPVTTAIMWIIGSLILWVVSAGIAHLCARYIFGGMGAYTQLLKLYGYAIVPSSLVILGMVLVGLNFLFFFSYCIVLCLIAIFWMVSISVVAVERCHLIDPGKAFISSFILPLVVYMIIFSLLTYLLSLSLGGFLI